jgi:geranylgeranyl diphosphate synthase, type I
MASLKSYIAEHSVEVRKVLEQFFDEKVREAEVLTPHLVQSMEVLRDFTLRGGKQIRPALVLLATQLAGGKLTPGVYQVAAAVEVFHKHILNLDDMADRDELRYGGPTVWKKYEEIFHNWKDVAHHARSFSEIDGTLLGSFAFELVRTADVPAQTKLDVMEVLNKQMYFETVAGWQIHYYQNQEKLSEASEQEFIKGLDLVTSRYTFVGPLRIGVLLSSSTKKELSTLLEQFGLDVGLAFQVTDDVLGLFGNPKETGKAVGNDVREGKKTLLLQKAYRAASQEDKQFLEAICGSDISEAQLVRAQEIVKSTGALEASFALAGEKIDQASQLLSSYQLDQQSAELARVCLLELAASIRQRTK